MQSMRLILFFFLLAAVLPGCKNGKTATQQASEKPSAQEHSYSDMELLFGMGGGVTGKYEEFLVQPTGQVLKKGYTDEEPVPWKKLDRQQTDSLFAKAVALDLRQVQHNIPGNLTRYLEFRGKRPLPPDYLGRFPKPSSREGEYLF